MIKKIGKKSFVKVQIWVCTNVLLELIATAVIGLSLSSMIGSKDNICVMNTCMPQQTFFLWSIILLLVHPLMHSITLYQLLKETSILGLRLSNEIVLSILKQKSSFSSISDDEKLKITTVEAQRITSSIISPAARVLPSVITTLIVLLFCGYHEPAVTVIIFLILTSYYIFIVVLTKNLSGKISRNLSDLIALRFKNIRALIQNSSFFSLQADKSLLYQHLTTKTPNLAAVDALGQVVAQSPRKGLEAIIVLFLIFGVYYFNGQDFVEASTISILAVLVLKVLPNFQAIYHSVQQIRNNLTAYTEASGYLTETLEYNPPRAASSRKNVELENQLKISNLTVAFPHEIMVYPDIEFDLKKLNIIIGPSGCGKSTLLKALSNHINYGGKIEYPNDIDRSRIVYYGQTQTLLPGSLLENLCPYAFQSPSKEEFSEVLERFRVSEIMKDHNLDLDTPILSIGNKELSDGQKQRILLARTFLTNPDLILLDEPTSNLDEINAALIVHALRDYSKTKNIILTSHTSFAPHASDKLIVLS